tara:strand:- start:3362 stop:5092 length:1731 start_codon:yes stop_codon:yes gene_type:complete
MPKVYQLQLPPGVQPGSRAAGYISTYQKGRYDLWNISMKQAALDLKLDREDYVARRKIAEAMRKTLREEIADIQVALDDLNADNIDQRRAIEERRVSADMSADKHNSSQSNSWGLAVAPTDKTSTRSPSTSTRSPSTSTRSGGTSVRSGTPGDPEAPAGPLIIPDADQERVAQNAIPPELNAITQDVAANAVVFSPTSTLADIEAHIAAAQQNLMQQFDESGQGAVSFHRNVSRYIVADQLIEQAAAATGHPPDTIREALRIGASPRFISDYEEGIKAIHELSPLPRPRTARGTAASTTTTGPSVTSNSGYTTENSGYTTTSTSKKTPDGGPLLVSPGSEALILQDPAELEARLAQLGAELEALEVPPENRKNLLAEARKHYTQDFGFDRLRTPSAANAARSARRGQPSLASLEALRLRLETDGVDSVRNEVSRQRQPQSPAEVPAASEATPAARQPPVGLSPAAPDTAPTVDVPGVGSVPARISSPIQKDQAARQRAMVSGAAAAHDEDAFKALDTKTFSPIIQQLFGNGNGTLTQMEDEVIQTFTGTEQEEALAYLHALRARSIESTMAAQSNE